MVTVWLTGLSGSGKTTIGRLVRDELSSDGTRVELLDGDEVREVLSPNLGFTRAERDVNVRRLAFVADLLSRNGVVAIVAAISPYQAARDAARSAHGDRFMEVFVRASVGECTRRDTKGLYEKARRGEIEHFTGVSDPYEAPVAPELVCDTEVERPQDSAGKVLEQVRARLGDYRLPRVVPPSPSARRSASARPG